MGNLKMRRKLRETCTLEELALHCRDFGRHKIKNILQEALLPYEFYKGVFSYDTKFALNAIYEYRRSIKTNKQFAQRRVKNRKG